MMDGIVLVLLFENFTFNVVPETKSLDVNYSQVTDLASVADAVLQVP